MGFNIDRIFKIFLGNTLALSTGTTFWAHGVVNEYKENDEEFQFESSKGSYSKEYEHCEQFCFKSLEDFVSCKNLKGKFVAGKLFSLFIEDLSVCFYFRHERILKDGKNEPDYICFYDETRAKYYMKNLKNDIVYAYGLDGFYDIDTGWFIKPKYLSKDIQDDVFSTICKTIEKNIFLR